MGNSCFFLNLVSRSLKAPESTGTDTQSTETAVSGSATASSAASTGGRSSGSSSGSSSHTGAIAGGVVGGVVLAFLFLRRRNTGKAGVQGLMTPTSGADAHLTGNSYPGSASGMASGEYQAVPYTPGAYDQPNSTGSPYNQSFTATNGAMSMPQPQMQKLYDPNDPSTFPPSLGQQYTGQTYNSGTGSNSYSGSGPTSMAAQGGHVSPTGPNSGMYRGMAEV